MESFGKLKLRWSLGYKGSAVHFVDETTLVYGCGNSLTFIRSSGEHVASLSSEGRGVGPIAVNQSAGLVAYAEDTLQPLIFVLKYPQNTVQFALSGKTRLGYTNLAFSSNGKQLCSLSGIPDFLLTIWDCTDGIEICDISVGPGITELSFNPLNWKQICSVGPQRITFYTLEISDSQKSLTPLEVQLPDKTACVGSQVSPLDPPITLTKNPTIEHTTKKLEKTDTRSSTFAPLYSPPDMDRVLYAQSYDEFVAKKAPVFPTSHCWTTHQSVYIGCRGGQLLLAEFESGVAKMVCNPEVLEEEAPVLRVGKDRPEDQPMTGHALLHGGSLQSLTLSRKGLFAGGENGEMYCFEQKKELNLLDMTEIQYPISCLAWSPSYSRMAIGSNEGTIHVVDPLRLCSAHCIVEHTSSPFIGLDMLTPGLRHCVTCRSEGVFQVWDIHKPEHVSTLDLKTKCTALACPNTCHMAVVGTAVGHLLVVSLVEPLHPKVLMEKFMYNSQVRAIRCDQNGYFMASISPEGPLFVYNSSPSKDCCVIGQLAIEGELCELSVLSQGRGVDTATTTFAVLAKCNNTQTVTVIHIPNTVANGVPSKLYSVANTKELSDEFVSKQTVALAEPITGLTLAPKNTLFALLECKKKFSKFILPEVEQEKGVLLSPEDAFPAHELKGGCVALSFHQKWMCSVAPDGKLLVRLLENPEQTVSASPHHYKYGGGSIVIFSTDSQHFITAGDSGCLTCWGWEFTAHGSSKGSTAAQFAKRCINAMEKLHDDENAVLASLAAADEEAAEKTGKDLPPLTSAPAAKQLPDKPWLEKALEETQKEEDSKFAEIKQQLRQELDDLRQKVLSMINFNEQLPEIEKLEGHEYILDTEDYQRIQAEEETMIKKVQEEIEFSNLAKRFLREKIKEQCIDGMKVKGRVVKAFQSKLEVSNYPLKGRSEAVLQELERVQTLRKIEIAEEKVRKEIMATSRQTLDILPRGDELEDSEFYQTGEPTEEEEPEGDPCSLLGSVGSLYGGESQLLYNQFELNSPVVRKHQMLLLQDCVYRIKESFNKEFDEVIRLKENEIAHINERNVRINKIMNDLKVDEKLVKPCLDSFEQPEALLTVQDSEIKIEKYISPEEKKRLAEVAKTEEERRIAERGDNARERALDMMMGGRLEANAEEDLFKDLPRPEFMQKDPTEMTEEEIRMVRDFEKKEAEFLEEREKLKKALEAELKKLQSTNIQSMENFDERLGKFFQLKINTEMAIHQEELKILRLAVSFLVEEEVAVKEELLNHQLEEKKVLKVQLGGVLNTAKRQVEDSRELYEQLVAEDKEIDKGFRKEFADCEPHVDQLHKLFRRRPRGHQRLKPGPSGEKTLIPNATSQNPFASVASPGRDEDPMAELDLPSNIPEGLDPSAWERFVAARRRKVDSEHKVKGMALKLAEMEAIFRKRQLEDDKLQQDIQNIFKEQNKLQEDKTVFDLNLEIQFLLKQGQVEVDFEDVLPDFSDSVLIHRRVIEELNSQIKTLGEAKINSMVECKDFKKGIRMLEWELKKLKMEAEDFINKARDIQLLRVTKELQQRLMEENVDSKDQREIETLERTLELNQKMHHRKIRSRKRKLERMKRDVETKQEESQQVDRMLMELQIDVLERKQIEELAGVPAAEANREKRMREILYRKKLVELAKNQAEEVAVLRNEVERLRMRTFPALVQVDN